MKKHTNRLTLTILSIAIMGTVFTACKKKGSTIPPPDPIGGFQTSNDVGAANLLAHWTFDGSLNESISSTAPTTSTGSSFAAGVKGQAVTFAGGYALYPVISKCKLLG
jgi:hypothetical protein